MIILSCPLLILLLRPQVGKGTDELGSVYAKYVRERGEVEREYARALRKLVAKHQPKDQKKVQETTQVTQLTWKT